MTGCGNATTLITTGDRIEINGDLGLVARPLGRVLGQGTVG